MKTWFLYIVKCNDDSLYTGVSNDVQRRFREHEKRGSRCSKYLRGKAPLQLVYSVAVGEKGEALRIEHRIKSLSRKDKERLIRGALSIKKFC